MKFPILTAAVLMLSAVPAQADSRPNIVFVFSDDHATQAISSYGGRLAEVAPTPNLDRIAEEGDEVHKVSCHKLDLWAKPRHDFDREIQPLERFLQKRSDEI